MSRLSIWVVYDHPADWPEYYVAREWIGDQPGNMVTLDRNLDRLRERLQRLGLVRLERMPEDEPHILETWL